MSTTSRRELDPTGRYRSVPQAFAHADPGVRHAIKIDLGQPGGRPATDRLVVDLAAVDPAAFDAGRVIRDCELVAELARSHPETLARLLEITGRGTAAPDELERLYRELDRIGFTEEAAVAKGGGIIWLVVLVGAAVLVGGCPRPLPPVKHPLGQPSPGPGTGPSTGPASQPATNPAR